MSKTKKLIYASEEFKKLKKNELFYDRGFLVSITKQDGSQLFEPYMVNNFSINKNRIFITIYDIIGERIIEQDLDYLNDGFLCLKPSVKITLYRLDSSNNEVYSVEYERCKLKSYHGNNFSYRGKYPYQWYLEFSYSKKTILKSLKSTVVPFDTVENEAKDRTNLFEEYYGIVRELAKPNSKERKEKDLKTLKYSNMMLDEAIHTVYNTDKLPQNKKNDVVRQINNAKEENERMANKVYNQSLDNIDLNKIEKDLEKRLKELETIND